MAAAARAGAQRAGDLVHAREDLARQHCRRVLAPVGHLRQLLRQQPQLRIRRQLADGLVRVLRGAARAPLSAPRHQHPGGCRLRRGSFLAGHGRAPHIRLVERKNCVQEFKRDMLNADLLDKGTAALDIIWFMTWTWTAYNCVQLQRHGAGRRQGRAPARRRPPGAAARRSTCPAAPAARWAPPPGPPSPRTAGRPRPRRPRSPPAMGAWPAAPAARRPAARPAAARRPAAQGLRTRARHCRALR